MYLEGGYKLDYLALDKTGTITHGKPVQTDYLALFPNAGDSAPAGREPGRALRSPGVPGHRERLWTKPHRAHCG